jgi:hypothetical protein
MITYIECRCRLCKACCCPTPLLLPSPIILILVHFKPSSTSNLWYWAHIMLFVLLPTCHLVNHNIFFSSSSLSSPPLSSISSSSFCLNQSYLEEPNRLTWRNRIGYPAQPGLIRPSVCPSVCTYLQIRYSAENGTGPTDLVNYSSKSCIYDVNCESEILRKKYICESNTVNNMKLMILEKIRVIRTCSSSPRAASVLA